MSPSKSKPSRKRATLYTKYPQAGEELLGPISEDALNRILKITKVAGGLQNQYYARISIDLAVHSLSWERWQGKSRGESRALKTTFRSLAACAQQLQDMISGAVERLGEHSTLLEFESSSPDSEEDNNFGPHDLMSILMDFTANCEQIAAPLKKKEPHRPRGTVQKPALHFLIGKLYEAIEFRCGGELTLWQDAGGELKGTLPAVLKIVHELFPQLVPANPPYATLRRFLSEAKTTVQ